MKILRNFILILFSSLVVFYGCTSSDYTLVKVHKSVFIPDSIEVNRTNLITGGIKICTLGQRYYHRSLLLGGGARTFTGFAIPPGLAETEYGYYVMAIKNNLIRITGKGKTTGYDGQNPAEVELIASPDEIMSVLIRN